MKILQRYYLKEFFKLFAILSLGLGILSSLIDLIEKIDEFVRHSPPVTALLSYSALNIPRYLVYLMPMASLISSLFVFSQAGRRRETVAFRASGGSMKGLLAPFVYSGVLLCIAGLLIGEFVAPDFSGKARRLRNAMAKKADLLTVKGGRAWLKAGEYIIKIDLYLPDRGIIQGVSMIKVEDDTLTERVDADSGEWQPAWESLDRRKAVLLQAPRAARSGGVWLLRGVTVYDTGTGQIAKLKELPTDIIESPDIIGKSAEKPEEMTARDLFSYTRRLKEAGMKNTKLFIDLYSKFSYPLINLIMVVLGISLAARGEMKSGLVTTAVGLFISLVYWVGYTASLSLGYTGILPPVIAAWIVPVLFGIGALHLFRGIPE